MPESLDELARAQLAFTADGGRRRPDRGVQGVPEGGHGRPAGPPRPRGLRPRGRARPGGDHRRHGIAPLRPRDRAVRACQGPRARRRLDAGAGGVRARRARAVERRRRHVPLPGEVQAGRGRAVPGTSHPGGPLPPLGLRPEGRPLHPDRGRRVRPGEEGDPDDDLPPGVPLRRGVRRALRLLPPRLQDLLHDGRPQGLRPRPAGGPGGAARQVRGHRVQPGARHQERRRRAARLPELALDVPGQARHQPDGRAGRGPPAERRGGERVQPGLRLPAARAQRAAFREPAADRRPQPGLAADGWPGTWATRSRSSSRAWSASCRTTTARRRRSTGSRRPSRAGLPSRSAGGRTGPGSPSARP